MQFYEIETKNIELFYYYFYILSSLIDTFYVLFIFISSFIYIVLYSNKSYLSFYINSPRAM